MHEGKDSVNRFFDYKFRIIETHQALFRGDKWCHRRQTTLPFNNGGLEIKRVQELALPACMASIYSAQAPVSKILKLLFANPILVCAVLVDQWTPCLYCKKVPPETSPFISQWSNPSFCLQLVTTGDPLNTWVDRRITWRWQTSGWNDIDSMARRSIVTILNHPRLNCRSDTLAAPSVPHDQFKATKICLEGGSLACCQNLVTWC